MDQTDQTAKDIADQIRGSQIHAMESNVPKSMVGYLAAAALASFIAFAEWAWLLVAWAPLILAISVARIVLALKTARLPPGPRSLQDERRLQIATAIVSLTMALAPTWIVLHSEGVTTALMLMLMVSTLWGGVLVQAPMFSSAVSYACAPLPIWLVYLAMSDLTQGQIVLGALFVVTSVVALDNVKRYAASFEAELRQRMTLQRQSDQMKQQADVIGLLLKDHEDQSSDWLWQTDRQGRVVEPSARFTQAFGERGQPLAGAAFLELFAAGEVRGNAEALTSLREHLLAGRPFRDRIVPGRQAGHPRWWSISGRPVLDASGALRGFRGVMGDVTIAKEAQAHVDYLAHHDALTGLANRMHFQSRVQSDLDVGGRRTISLVSLDLDGLKAVNDRFGHPTGDAVLVVIAGRLRTVTSANGVVARLGGDEFAIAANGLDLDALEGLCRGLIDALGTPIRIGADDILIGATIGVAVAPTDGRTVAELLKNAEAALHRAKREGRGQYRFFEAGMDRQIQLRALLLQDLRDALPADQLTLHYQPFVDARTGSVTGCEALLRWGHPTRGMISPAEFIPLAEESGLITTIGKWVIERACRSAVRWPGDVRVSVNVSPRQFKDSHLPAHIEAVLSATGLAPRRLEIEVTEAVLIDDAGSALEILRRIRAIGVKLALDDFGTGYSSLSYLRDFPFDKVKIDRSFVRDIEDRRDSQVIVQGIRSIALGLGMTITAEGVETAGQAQRLRTSGCHELQGFLFSKPRPEAEIPALLEQRHVLPPVEDEDASAHPSGAAPAEQRAPRDEAVISLG